MFAKQMITHKNLKLKNFQRFVVTQTVSVNDNSSKNLVDTNWNAAKPFKDLPGPTKFQLLKSFLPGGNLYKKSIVEINGQLRKDYGDILLVPGILGKRNVLITFNPSDFQMIFRTEGVYPIRRGLDIVHYYRKVLKPGIFSKAAGLAAEQGEGWGKFRSTVNPVLMNPKTIKQYAPKLNTVCDRFLKRIRQIRDPLSFEVPATFEHDLVHLTMDSLCLVALDTDLDMINNSTKNPKVEEIAINLREFFEAINKLDFQPSLWKFIATPTYKSCIDNLNKMYELTVIYIDKAMENIKFREKLYGEKPKTEQSILERLIRIDRDIGIVMAMDLLMAGIDTTASAFVGCLLTLAANPEKQNKLRQEVISVLPNKDTAVTNEKLTNLPYLRACIKEALRIYPVSPSNFRATGQNIVLSGYQVPKDVDILMPSQLLMCDEKYYERAQEFIPERWLRHQEIDEKQNCPHQTQHKNNPFAFLPFGFGSRICIGKRIVDLELEVHLLKLVRNFDIRFDNSMDKMFKTNIINVPAKPLQFKFVDLNV